MNWINNLVTVRTDSNPAITEAPPTVEAFIESHGLTPTLTATGVLLADMFGPGARVLPRLTADRETGEPVLVFDLMTPVQPSFEQRDRFIDRFIAEVPNSVGLEAPTLIWNPDRV